MESDSYIDNVVPIEHVKHETDNKASDDGTNGETEKKAGKKKVKKRKRHWKVYGIVAIVTVLAMMWSMVSIGGTPFFGGVLNDIIGDREMVKVNTEREDGDKNKIDNYDEESVYEERVNGERREIVVDTIGYTGWKLVCVMPYSIFSSKMLDIKQFVLILILLMAMMLTLINRLISVRISRPIMKLNNSVTEYEEGKESEIYIGGSREIRHLGRSIRKSYKQNTALMQKIVWEQTERRKSELEVLQSQINPHFLYNTLDSITWMIEGERNDEAVFMISQLARLFRISLSKGHTIISIKDELQHAQSYMNIQKVRYKNKFQISFDIAPDILDCCIVKLILQPILENAINYGVREMDDCGEIIVRGSRQKDEILLTVTDNGMGIPEEEVEFLLTDTKRVHKKGSGVGLVNVNNRIKILFGEQYGLHIESELDEGTTVSIKIPAIIYSEENRKKFESSSQKDKQEET